MPTLLLGVIHCGVGSNPETCPMRCLPAESGYARWCHCWLLPEVAGCGFIWSAWPMEPWPEEEGLLLDYMRLV